ncbi:hypothetical protein D0Z07_9042 [Hyphodiscus hymeniophilus]|uniref:Uncharacterized protein n=1 Tax=Hyphodiscus hymeniophilus TaxID=353542 RepID=A0A9P6SLG1_9HELO|nr:hypothetical protein D0Z07_9042 [Hyphodiscus hymeniophilus]
MGSPSSSFVQIAYGMAQWARRDGMFTTGQEQPSNFFQSHEELDTAWNSWARLEEKKRAAMGLYIHDAQLASLFHHDPNLRHGAIQLSAAASNELFSAPSAAQWADLMRTHPPQSYLQEHIHFSQPQDLQQHPLPIEIGCAHSRLSCYVTLHGIEAAVAESGRTYHVLPNQQIFDKFRDALTCWYHAYGKTSSPNSPDIFCLMILWHKIFMSLLVDFDSLERAIGRDGSVQAAFAQEYVSTWASSIEAKRCIMHASLINDHLAAMRVDAEPAIHVPGCTFSAAIAWYCYTKFGVADNHAPDCNENLDFPETKALGIRSGQQLFELCGATRPKPTVMGAGPLRGLTDMLNKLGHWDTSKRFAGILGLLLHGDTEGHLLDYS